MELAERVITPRGNVLIPAHIVHSNLVYTARPVNFNRVASDGPFVFDVQDATHPMPCNLRGGTL